VAGNAACTVITVDFARRLGLVNEDGAPTQAHGGRIKAQGIVPDVTVDLPIINIEYHIKGDTLALASPATFVLCACLCTLHESSHRLMH